MLFLQLGLQNALHCATLSPWSQEGTPRVVKLPPRPKVLPLLPLPKAHAVRYALQLFYAHKTAVRHTLQHELSVAGEGGELWDGVAA